MNIQVTLKQLLLSREIRKAKQLNLINTYGKSLISFMVNMPGDIKDTDLSRKIHELGMQLLDQHMEINNIDVLYRSVENKVTGTEGFMVIDYPTKEMKKQLIKIEDSDPIGRLFDFDVINENHQILSRAMFNKGRRKCLLCNEDAATCGRTQKHKYEQILQKMEDMVQKRHY